MSATHAVRAQELTRRFGDFTAVDNVSFDVAAGEIFGYLGANGAGKSTTIRMLCGLLAPTGGRAEVAGRDVKLDPRGVKAQIGYMSQRFSLYLDLTVEENLSFFAGAYGLRGSHRRTRLTAALELAGLTDRRRMLTRQLPGGIRQRLALASALLHEPRVVFLDEPTAGVDPGARRSFWRIIRRIAGGGTTVFVTTHHLDEAELCHRVGLMVDGRLVALDSPAGLKQTHVPGAMFAVEGIPLGALRARLPELPAALDAQPFGRRLHLRMRDAAVTPEELGRLLGERALHPSAVERIEPSLEDVFLALVGGVS